MINNLMYVELKTGYSDDDPAWIGNVNVERVCKSCLNCGRDIMLNLVVFETEEELCELTGLTEDELW